MAGVGCFQDWHFCVSFSDQLCSSVLPGFLSWFTTLSDVLVVGESGCGGEDSACVDSVESARFGGWVEYLRFGEFVVRNVVD